MALPPQLGMMLPDSGVSAGSQFPDFLDVPLESEIEVEMTPDGVEITQAGGEIIVDFDPQHSGMSSLLGGGEAFGANLAEVMEEEDLMELGGTICDWVGDDEESRSEWWETLAKGMQRLGVYGTQGEDDGPFEGASGATHPLIIESATQFQARAMAELMPSEGPVGTKILGTPNEEVRDQADRVRDYMNYQLLIEDRSYYDQKDQQLFTLAFTGSEFDKQYYCPLKKKVRSVRIKAQDFIMPYDACGDLAETSRYTHRLRYDDNTVKKLQRAGFYRSVELAEAAEDTENDPVEEITAEMEGRSKGGNSNGKRVLYEMHVDLDLAGFEDPEGIMMPYIVTVDKDSRQVLSVYRNWRKADTDANKRVWFTHKKFLPGFGAYGLGFLHAIGGLGDAATGALRALLDAAGFATLQGGFKSKDAKLSGDTLLEPGVWLDTEMSAEELSKAFYTPPFKEPSATLFQLLGFLEKAGQRFAATTEVMVGDASTNGPVGTTVALIEQGSKVFSGIHKRLHKAFADEFIHIAELNAEYLPEVYPYALEGKDGFVARADFDERVDVVPVSDPNIFSHSQRIAQAQATLQMAQQAPQMYDMYEAHREMLKALRHPNINAVLPDKTKTSRMDAVTENAYLMVGRGPKVFMDQDHQAHMQIHMTLMQQAQNDQILQQAIPVIAAHIAEHKAMQMYIVTLRSAGIPPMPLDLQSKPGEVQVPPQMDAQISAMAAQTITQAIPPPPPTPEQVKSQETLQKAELDGQVKVQVAQLNAQSAGQIAQIEGSIKQQMAELQHQHDMMKLQADTAQAERDRQHEAMMAQLQSRLDQTLETVKAELKQQGEEVNRRHEAMMSRMDEMHDERKGAKEFARKVVLQKNKDGSMTGEVSE